jgi:hypothetical protein
MNNKKKIKKKKDEGQAGCQYFTPVTLAVQESEIRRISSKPAQANSL